MTPPTSLRCVAVAGARRCRNRKALGGLCAFHAGMLLDDAKAVQKPDTTARAVADLARELDVAERMAK